MEVSGLRHVCSRRTFDVLVDIYISNSKLAAKPSALAEGKHKAWHMSSTHTSKNMFKIISTSRKIESSKNIHTYNSR